ncbi:MAG: hypothetical protein GY771_12075 [bacterium]|nr:hypothetical protein [bacterium]
MSRVLLRVDLDLTALEDELVEAINKRIEKGEELDKGSLKEVVHDILSREMVEEDKCGKILFCHQVHTDDTLGTCAD